MLRSERTPQRDTVDVEAYEVWRACKDVERLLFMFQAAKRRPPPELERLESWVKTIAAANNVNLHSQ